MNEMIWPRIKSMQKHPEYYDKPPWRREPLFRKSSLRQDAI